MTTWHRASTNHVGTARLQGPRDTRASGRVRLVGGAAGLGVATAALWWSGHAMPGPSSFDRQDVTSWLGTSDPVVAAFALMRLAGLALAGWVALTGGLALLVHLSRLRRIRWLRRLVDRLCLPVVRRLVHGAAGVALAAATLAPGAAGALDSATASTTPARGEVAALVALEPTAVPPTEPTDATAGLDRAVIITIGPTTLPTPPDPPPTTSHASTEPLLPLPSHPPTVAAQTPPAASIGASDHTGTWRIEPGQHLWHVAESTLAEHLGGTPDDETVAAYLTALIEANRDRLVVPTNPDLVFAGQELVLPPLTPEQ